MNAKKWWAIPLMIIGAMGLAASLIVSFSQGDQPALRLLVTIIGDIASQPAVWVGIGGIFLWRSGSKQLAAESAGSLEMKEPSAQAAAVNSPSEPSPEVPRSRAETQGPSTGNRVGPWVVAGVALVVAIGLGGYIIGSNQNDDGNSSVAATPEISTTTPVRATTSTVTSTTAAATPEPTWVLEEFNGSWYIDGSVTPVVAGTLVEYVDTGEDLYLAIDGTPSYNVQTWACLTTDCDENLVLTINTPSEPVWVLDARQPNGDYEFSDLLHHEIRTSGEDLAACWSPSFAGPVVAVMNGSTISRAWVLPDVDTGGTWLGVDASTIDAARMVPAVEFAGEVLSSC